MATLPQPAFTAHDAASPWLRFACDEAVGSHAAVHDFALSRLWTCLFGPSGSGKSTLLRLIAGLRPQQSGACLLYGDDLRGLPAHRRRIALVEQSPALFPHRDVEGNVTFARRARLTGRQGSRPQPPDDGLEAILNDFQLTGLRHAAVHTLSGGERQRVAIARALYSRPRGLLLDEVFTGMDAALRTSLITALRQYQERTHMPILSVTHDVGEAFATADEVLRMHNGHTMEQGTPAQVLRQERSELMERLSSEPSAGE